MSVLDSLLACSGHWAGTYRLHDPQTGRPDDSDSTLVVTPMLGGRFVRLDYRWAWRQTPQEGSLLVGCEESGARVTAQWVDTWHMSDRLMACSGAAGDGCEIVVRGAYAAPPGPDWGWRTLVAPASRRLRIVMHNITPDGREDTAVEAMYERAAAG